MRGPLGSPGTSGAASLMTGRMEVAAEAARERVGKAAAAENGRGWWRQSWNNGAISSF